MNGFPRHSLVRAALVAVALAAVASGAPPSFPVLRWSTLNAGRENTAPPPGSEPAAACYTATRSGVVTLKFTAPGGVTWQGTGFLIGSKGVVVTNYHLIEGAIEGQAALGAESRKIDGLLGYDQAQDLALLKIDVAGLDVSPLGLAAAVPAAKTAVTAVGGPWRFADAINEGELVAAESGEEVKKRSPELASSAALTPTTEWLVITAPVSPGNSGGPLVAPGGTVAGVLTWSRATAGKLNRAAPVSALRRLMAAAELEAAPLKDVAAREAATKPSADVPAAGEFETGWMGPRHYSRSDAANAITRASQAAQCPRCNGTGTLTVTHLVPRHARGVIQNDEVQGTETCPECGGAGLRWTDRTEPILAALVQAVMLTDRKGLAAADYTRMVSAGADAFRTAALDNRPDGRKANESLDRALANLRAARSTPAVFYAAVMAKVPYDSEELYVVRTFSVNQTIFIHGRTLVEGRSYLMGGLWAGTVTVPVAGGATCGPGLEALWAEPLH